VRDARSIGGKGSLCVGTSRRSASATRRRALAIALAPISSCPRRVLILVTPSSSSRPRPRRAIILVAHSSSSCPHRRLRRSIITVTLPVVVEVTLTPQSRLSCSRHYRHCRTLVESSLSYNPSCEPHHVAEENRGKKREREREGGDKRGRTREAIRERAHKGLESAHKRGHSIRQASIEAIRTVRARAEGSSGRY
jgi:hypothetical protein